MPKSRAKDIFQTTSKITSACSIRPIWMTYRLLNVFVYCYGHIEIIYAVSRFKLFLCVRLRGVLLPDEIFLVFILCNLIFGEISEWFIMNSLRVTHSTAQCHRRGQDAVSAKAACAAVRSAGVKQTVSAHVNGENRFSK